jgi:glycosyltransferase involved in cell wall biosynthesis
MIPRRIHILYEYGVDLQPHGSAQIRLLRPLTHPALRTQVSVSADREYLGEAVEAVIIDRLWRPDISLALAHDLERTIRQAKARLIYALDDDFLTLPPNSRGWPTDEHKRVVEFFLQQADAVLVTTPMLRERFAAYNAHITIMPNALDERLLVGAGPTPIETPFGQRKTIIGYMGTTTHDADLQLILPAWQMIRDRHPGEVEFQVMGVAAQAETVATLNGLGARLINPRTEEVDYPLFMLWFTGRVNWDIALSPLQMTAFNACKSDIKFLDYSAIGAAGVFSRVPAYEATVQHRVNGWLAENTVEDWVEALEFLLANQAARLNIGRAANQYLRAARVVGVNGQVWREVLPQLLPNLEGANDI